MSNSIPVVSATDVVNNFFRNHGLNDPARVEARQARCRDGIVAFPNGPRVVYICTNSQGDPQVLSSITPNAVECIRCHRSTECEPGALRGLSFIMVKARLTDTETEAKCRFCIHCSRAFGLRE